MNSHEVFIHIHQGCFAGTGAIVRLPQCQWSKPDGYGKISQCITTTKHNKAKTVCIFLVIYCTSNYRKTWTIFRVKGNITWAEIRMFHHMYFIKIDSPNIYYKITNTTSYHKSPLWRCLYALRSWFSSHNSHSVTVYPKKYAHGFCFAVLCCGYTLTDFPISIRLTSLALWQSNDCPSASKATLMNMDKYFMWIHYERLHNHNKAKHNKTVCIFLGIYCMPTNELAMQKIDTL